MGEGLTELYERGTKDLVVFMCADNQNRPKALAGGPSAGREYVGKCRKEIETLQRNGCKVLGKCTPFYQNIPGNEHAVTLPKRALERNQQWKWTRTTLSWLRSRPHHHMIEPWATPSHNGPKTKSFGPTARMRGHKVRGISRITLSFNARNP